MKKRQPIKRRGTLPKAIAAAVKAGDKPAALDLATYGEQTTSLRELARELCWFCHVQAHRKPFLAEFGSMLAGGERVGWEPPPKPEKKSIREAFNRWHDYKLKELVVHLRTGHLWHGKTFLRDLDRECKRVRNIDAVARPFEKPGIIKSENDNPNWFRAFLIANSWLPKPLPLFRIAKEIGIDVRTLRREARKQGVKRGKSGKPYLP